VTPLQRRLIVQLSGVVSFLGALIFAWVIIVSFYSPSPLEQKAAITYPLEGAPTAPYKVLVEERTVQGFRNESIYMHRTLYRKIEPNESIIVEGGGFDLKEGDNSIVRPLFLPPYAKGYWCSHAEITWWPSWSQREFSQQLPDVCFVVE
jgi:hypothetical protein